MKIIRSAISTKDQNGFVTLQAEEDEDMYHLYNLISKDDEVEAVTLRNVVTENSNGNRERSRVQTKMTIRVETVEFDAEQCALRLKGVNVRQNQFIQMGQYHTLEIELNRPFSIGKSIWDPLNLELLRTIANPMKTAEVAALVMQEGLAHLCLVKSAMTKTCARIEKHMPKKKQGNQAFEKAMTKFYDEIYNAIIKFLDFETVKVVLVGSPGFLKDEFLNYLNEKAIHDENILLKKNKSKFLKLHSSSGYKSAIDELLSNNEVQTQLTSIKAVDEVRALKKFCDIMNSDPDRACYGLQDVITANEHLAINELLVSDRMYRSTNFEERNKYMDLIESVKSSNGKVFLFSSLHVSGEQLNNFTGIAAILRFPLPEDESGRVDHVDNSDANQPESGANTQGTIDEDIYNFL